MQQQPRYFNNRMTADAEWSLMTESCGFNQHQHHHDPFMLADIQLAEHESAYSLGTCWFGDILHFSF